MTEKKRRRTSKFHEAFWLSLSLSFAAIYGIMALPQDFTSEYIVGKDAREYMLGIYRLSDPQLFPHDLIANYFQSITPSGYAGLYHIMADLGITPVLLSKLLPPALGLIATGYCFAVCMQILPVPMAGFIATLVLNQSLGLHDDVVSATPRGFFYPLFLAFLYYLLKRSLLPCLVVIALQALFYPLIPFISSGILLLRLLNWEKGGKLRLSVERRDYLFCATGLGVALLALLPYMLASSEFGPSITTAQARRIPEYWSGGRVSYYFLNPWNFWLDGRDSGMFALLSPPQLFIGLLLPLLLRWPSRFPLAKRVKSTVKILPQIVLASVAMFFAAHALAFKLHFPSRYTFHTFQMVLSLACGIALTLMLDAVFHWSEQRTTSRLGGRKFLAISSVVVVVAALVLYPCSLKSFPKTLYVKGGVPALYQFLQQQPKDSLVASLTSEADNLPTFAKRSILVGKEYALPFHTRYYAQFRQRAIDLIDAQYSLELKQVKGFIHKYGVNFWLLDQAAFQPGYIANNNWIKQYQPAAAEAMAKLMQGETPALSKLINRCAVLQPESLIVLQARCIDEASSPKKG
ncbi:MAG: hypothetical protein JO235_18180 [Chroococcidiopsidaceae cyanobacterium CP_BM_RX_35]|nr:hypothetical protein [Chroococcidiopsidaceae cyanobacterium CP_BM_RX_35]